MDILFVVRGKAEKVKLDSLIRTGIKRVLGLPQSTSTEKLLELGLHNTIDELIEAHTVAQIMRLSSSKPGIKILEEAGIQPRHEPGTKISLTQQARTRIMVDPVPRNIHPVHNEGRRFARAKSILKKINQHKLGALFVDAARYDSGDKFAVSVVDAEGNLLNAASVYTKFAHVAEEAAIALAFHSAKVPLIIFSDSRTAVRSFSAALVSEQANNIVNKALQRTRESSEGGYHISWFPAHIDASVNPLGCNPNEQAHRIARDFTYRAVRGSQARNEVNIHKDPLCTFHEIVSHYRLGRRKFPPPHPKLNKPQASTLRLLQTRSYPTPRSLNRIDPDHSQSCSKCGHDSCSFDHMLWLCPALNASPPITKEQWEESLKSSNLQIQLQAVQRAHDIATGLGLPVPSWAEPPT